jgi:hypothetical protein
MHGVNVLLELAFATALDVTERAVRMLLSHVGLELFLGDETQMHGCAVHVEASRDDAVRAEELCSAMNSINMLA